MRWLKKKKKHPDLEFGFKDVRGRRYYRIPAHIAMPIERFGKLQENIMWQSAGLSGSELDSLVERMEEEMENLVQGKRGSLAKVGVVINEMKLRKQMVLHTELLYHFIAIQYIREDEDPAVYDDEIQNEKVEAFKEIVKKKDIHFLYHLKELKEVSKSLNLSQEELTELWRQSELEQKRMKEVIKALKSDLRSVKEKKTS